MNKPEATSEETKNNEQRLLVERRKMIFLMMLNQAMQYRESYYRDEVEEYGRMVFESRKSAGIDKQIDGDRGRRRRADAKVETLIIDYKNKMESFNTRMYNELEKGIKEFNSKNATAFDNWSAAFGLLSEEFMNAKNTTEIISIAKCYNQGLFAHVLEAIKDPHFGREGVEHIEKIDRTAQERVETKRPESVKDMIDTVPENNNYIIPPPQSFGDYTKVAPEHNV